MKGMRGGWALSIVLSVLPVAAAQAETFDAGIPDDWTCEGSCGTGIAEGVVTLAPAGGEQYGWVATTGSPLRSLGLPGVGGTNGSRLRSAPFTAEAGELLEFQFNYITSDGAGFADYAWARLLDASLKPVALLFTARTRYSGDIVPGFGMPDIAAEIDPETVNIIGGGPSWSPLGGNSGRCYASGCGYTDWVDSRYAIPAAGEYVLEFGVVNWSDTLFQSALAFDGVIVGGRPIGAQPDYREVRITANLAQGGIRLKADGFVVEPAGIEGTDGLQQVQWALDGFSLGQVQDLDFEVIVEDPRPGETRRVVEEIGIRYLDRAGQEHFSVLGPLDVEVRNSAFQLDVATDREVYLPGDAVRVVLDVTNQGSVGNAPAIGWEIQDAAGHFVAALPEIDQQSFEGLESRTFLEEGFDTEGLYAGEYVVVASLQDPVTEAVTQARANFRVAVPENTGLLAGVSVDRPAYDAYETAELTARLENTAPNLQIAGHEVRLIVLDPQGTEVWRSVTHPGSLPPGGLRDLVRQFPLGTASPGDYKALLVVIDETGSVTALEETGFRVRSTQETGAGLSGTLDITPGEVLRTEDLILQATVANDGNAGVSSVPVSLLLLDPQGESELGRWTQFMDLEPEATTSLSAAWNADVPAGTVLVAVLRAEFGDEHRVLATASARVQERFVSDPAADGRGRLLVLLDPPEPRECLAVEGLTLLLPGVGPLASGDRMQVDLHDASGRLLDSEAVHGSEGLPVDTVTGDGANILLSRIAGDALEVFLELNGNEEEERDSYQILATLHRDSAVHQFESGPVDSHCMGLPHPGVALGDFRLIDAAMQSAGPGTQRRAFLESLLDAEGWSYRIVTSAPAFAEGLRNGGYASFLLLADRVKLDNQVALELREAVFAGRGIVKAGAKDHRNRHLLEAFGADLLGSQPHAQGLLAHPAAPVGVPEHQFPAPARAVEVRLQEAFPVAEYRGDGRQRTHVTAASAYQFGRGRTLLVGFDLLAQARAQGPQGAFSRLLAEGLEFTGPNPAILRAGMAVPLRWSLVNRGGPASVLLTLETSGGQIADPGQGTLLGPRELSFALDLSGQSVEERVFWWILPRDAGDARVAASLDLQQGHDSIAYDQSYHDFGIAELPSFTQLRERIEGQLGVDRRYALALKELQRAEALHQDGETVQAVARLVKAADWLSTVQGPEARDIRASLGWLIHRLGPEIGAD